MKRSKSLSVTALVTFTLLVGFLGGHVMAYKDHYSKEIDLTMSLDNCKARMALHGLKGEIRNSDCGVVFNGKIFIPESHLDLETNHNNDPRLMSALEITEKYKGKY